MHNKSIFHIPSLQLWNHTDYNFFNIVIENFIMHQQKEAIHRKKWTHGNKIIQIYIFLSYFQSVENMRWKKGLPKRCIQMDSKCQLKNYFIFAMLFYNQLPHDEFPINVHPVGQYKLWQD